MKISEEQMIDDFKIKANFIIAKFAYKYAEQHPEIKDFCFQMARLRENAARKLQYQPLKIVK